MTNLWSLPSSQGDTARAWRCFFFFQMVVPQFLFLLKHNSFTTCNVPESLLGPRWFSVDKKEKGLRNITCSKSKFIKVGYSIPMCVT
jgi:hypothetical protein